MKLQRKIGHRGSAKSVDRFETFRAFLKEHGLSLTSVRSLVLEEAMRQRGHFQAEEIYLALMERDHSVSRDAVFRTLPLLLEAGLIQKSVGRGKGEYFETISEPSAHHDHMICLGCEKVIEFFSDELEKLQTKICQEHAFELVFHDHRLFGWCRSCESSRSRGHARA